MKTITAGPLALPGDSHPSPSFNETIAEGLANYLIRDREGPPSLTLSHHLASWSVPRRYNQLKKYLMGNAIIKALLPLIRQEPFPLAAVWSARSCLIPNFIRFF
jgi:hypothetical protein